MKLVTSVNAHMSSAASPCRVSCTDMHHWRFVASASHTRGICMDRYTPSCLNAYDNTSMATDSIS
eukprot:5010515-Lingulodinium_polyedra.AAC.1